MSPEHDLQWCAALLLGCALVNTPLSPAPVRYRGRPYHLTPRTTPRRPQRRFVDAVAQYLAAQEDPHAIRL